MTPAPALSVVVLSSPGDPTVEAVKSLLEQGEPAELVVSHSGGGSTPAVLRERYPHVAVETSAGLRTPGAARNAGVRASTRPHVAFLAGDCLARPGWVTGRLRRHRAGAVAVASAIEPPPRGAALAAHLLQHSYRMPHVSAAPHLRFGVSYTRELLKRYGPFREDLPGEEDVALNARLIAAGIEIEWAPEILTAHAYPTTIRGLVSDQYRRGTRRFLVRGGDRPRAVLAARALADAPAGVARAAARQSGVTVPALAQSGALAAVGAVATTAGILRPRRS